MFSIEKKNLTNADKPTFQNMSLGLREAEDCKCTSTDARSSARATVSFDANIDYNSLTDRSKNGLVKTKCPSFGSYSKQCTGNVHIWSYR